MNSKSIFSGLILAGVILFQCIQLYAQDSTKINAKKQIKYVEETFWSTKVFDGQSVETLPMGQINFIIQHRMGRIDDGLYGLFGLDQAALRLSVEYGPLNWLTIGAGRSTLDKYCNGFLKVKFFRQTKGKRVNPFSLSGVADVGLTTTHWEYPDRKNYFSSHLYYTFQLILATNLWNRLSLQVAPTMVHRNLVLTSGDNNDIFSIGFAGRVRISRMLALMGEYYYTLPKQIHSQINGFDQVNNLTAGIEINTGMHVFQILLSNSSGMNEKQFITENTENWRHKGFHLGFNITRLFPVGPYNFKKRQPKA